MKTQQKFHTNTKLWFAQGCIANQLQTLVSDLEIYAGAMGGRDNHAYHANWGMQEFGAKPTPYDTHVCIRWVGQRLTPCSARLVAHPTLILTFLSTFHKVCAELSHLIASWFPIIAFCLGTYCSILEYAKIKS